MTDDVLESDIFERDRCEVLESWKTGYRAKDLYANAEFLGRQPSFAAAQALVNAGRAPALIQPRAGVPLLVNSLLSLRLSRRVGVRVLSYQVDSLTRNNNYAGVEEALGENGLTGNIDNQRVSCRQPWCSRLAENNFRSRRPFTNPA